MAAAALIVSILSAIGVLWIGFQQVRLGREQLALTKRQAQGEERRDLERTSPALSIAPTSVSTSGSGAYDYHVEITNSGDVAARDVQVRAYIEGEVVAQGNVANVQRH